MNEFALLSLYGDLSVVSEREPVKRGGAPSATSALWLLKEVLGGFKPLSNLHALGFEQK